MVEYALVQCLVSI